MKRLGGTYGYERFRGSDGEKNVGIERMSLIKDYKEAVVTTNASPTIPETTMVRTVAAGEDNLITIGYEWNECILIDNRDKMRKRKCERVKTDDRVR